MGDQKGSDVLANLQSQMETILGYIANIDQNVKMILADTNVLGKKSAIDFALVPPSVKVVEPIVPGGKAEIIQKVVYKNTKKPVILVDVKVFDHLGILFKQTRTNAGGFWKAQLPVGEYSVEFTKGPSATNQPGFLEKSKISINQVGAEELPIKEV